MGRVANQALRSVWRQRIARQRRSGLSVAEFCRQEDVSQQSFYAWSRRLQETNRLASHTSLFVPVELPVHSAPADGVRVELPGGAVLTLPADASAELVTATIRALMSAASLEERPPC